MGTITLDLPNSVQRRLELLARAESISLTQYLFTLAVTQAERSEFEFLPSEEMHQQQARFQQLLKSLPRATSDEMDAYFQLLETDYHVAEPEEGDRVSPEVANKLNEMIAAAKQKRYA